MVAPQMRCVAAQRGGEGVSFLQQVVVGRQSRVVVAATEAAGN